WRSCSSDRPIDVDWRRKVMLADRRRTSAAQLIAFALHVAVFAILVALSRHRTTTVPAVGDRSTDQPPLVWVRTTGPGRGGGKGGGNGRPEPPRRIERAGRDQLSVPAPPREPSAADSEHEPRPIDRVIIPAVAMGSAADDLPGLIATVSAGDDRSRGSGLGDGVGPNRGPGLGSGSGPSIGDGDGDGIGPYEGSGNGVTMPVPLHVERPRYSTDAMRARVQGIVLVECVVRPTGTCSDIHVVRSLDPRFGLDNEATRAAALWRFRPGMRQGKPVAVRVTIELEFNVR